MTVMGAESLGTGQIHWRDGKRLERTSADQLQAGRTEAILKTNGNPVHLLLSNPQLSTPAAVLTALEGLRAMFARFGNRPSHR
jgi:hypothetical protein